MWNSALARRARVYRDATLSVVHPSGYPYSVRCGVELDDSRQIVRLTTVSGLAPGPGCLAFHRHDERLENQYQMLIRGQLEVDNGGVILRPTAFVTANGSSETDRMPHAGAPLPLIRFMLLGQKQARAYIRRRKSPWPRVDFDPMLRVLREVRSRAH
jgi:hypothetical protein